MRCGGALSGFSLRPSLLEALGSPYMDLIKTRLQGLASLNARQSV